MRAPKRTRSKRKTAGLARLATAARVAAIGVGVALGLSIVWAAAYAVVAPPGTILMAQRALSGQTIERRWTPLSEIAPDFLTAVIAAEDTRFCMHHGIDFDAIEEAIDAAEKGAALRGASTISQQTAKNAFLWNGGGWARKGAEAWMTALIELFWSKRRVMEVYVNIAEWGDGHFGVEAAAQARFGKSARALTAQEAALLAAVLPNPHKWRVDPPGPYVRGRAATLRKRMDQVRRDRLDACLWQ